MVCQNDKFQFWKEVEVLLARNRSGWRKQWEFPAGGIEEGETAREAAIRELYEDTHQKNERLEFKGLFNVEDAKENIKYQAIFVCNQEKLLPFEHSDEDEMNEIKLWNMQEDIGYVEACDVKIVQIVCVR